MNGSESSRRKSTRGARRSAALFGYGARDDAMGPNRDAFALEPPRVVSVSFRLCTPTSPRPIFDVTASSRHSGRSSTPVRGMTRLRGLPREVLCRDYWYPVYAFIRRSGYQGNDTEDLTQDFFAHILTRPWFTGVHQSKGRFRSFLLISLSNFLRDRIDRKKALKRGGTYQHVPLNMGSADARYSEAYIAEAQATEIYELEWANVIVEATLTRLEGEYRLAGKEALYRHLKTFLTTEGDASVYAKVSETLRTSIGNVRVGVHRLRKEYGALLREEVARTVAGADDVDEEMRQLRAVLAARQ